MRHHGSSQPLVVPVPAAERVSTPQLGQGRIEGPLDQGALRSGLCVSCERRLDCTFPLLDRSVWFCEEYE